MHSNFQVPTQSLNLGPARPLPGASKAGGSSRHKPSLPPKGWCWHRGAKLLDGGLPKGEVGLAIWHCSTCQNMTSLTSDTVSRA